MGLPTCVPPHPQATIAIAKTNADPVIGDVRGRGAMVAVAAGSAGDAGARRGGRSGGGRRAPPAGLVVLTCGTFGNAPRSPLPPVIGEELLEEGLSILEDAFATL